MEWMKTGRKFLSDNLDGNVIPLPPKYGLVNLDLAKYGVNLSLRFPGYSNGSAFSPQKEGVIHSVTSVIHRYLSQPEEKEVRIDYF